MSRISPPVEKGEKREWYAVRNRTCMGAECLRLHPIDVRGATGSGSRNTGIRAYECAIRYYYGCPAEVVTDRETEKARKAAGYRHKWGSR